MHSAGFTEACESTASVNLWGRFSQWVGRFDGNGLYRQPLVLLVLPLTVGTPKKDLPLSKVYQLLEPGTVVLLTTARKGRANAMAMSWHMMVEFEPPLVACVVSDANCSFAASRATKECVGRIPWASGAGSEWSTGVISLANGSCDRSHSEQVSGIGFSRSVRNHPKGKWTI